MTKGESRLQSRMIFVVGARRSGTLWLQRIIGAHPDIAEIPGETYLFSHGIKPLLERFHHGSRAAGRVGSLHADRDRLLDATREFCDRVLEPYLPDETSLLVERTPVHAQHLGLIADVYPDARVAHIIRDGRDVARSLVAQDWGPASIEEAAGEWRTAVMAGVRDADRFDRHVQVRYEDLLGDLERGVRSTYAALGVRLDAAAIEAGIAEGRARLNVDPTAASVASGKWRTELSESDLRAIDRVAGDVLEALGYARSDARVAPSIPNSAAAASKRAALRRAARAVAPARRRPRSATRQVRVAARVTNELLAAMNARRGEQLRHSLDPEALVRVVDPDRSRQARGLQAGALLASTVAEDPALGRPQRDAEFFPGFPTVAAVTTFELPDGTLADRLVIVSVVGERAKRMSLYRFPPRGDQARP